MKNEFYKTREEIEGWLNEHVITNYELIEDVKYGFVVNVIGDINLSWSKLNWIPIKFKKVSGGLYCSDNKLTSLEFCPEEVNGDFFCSFNRLISLEFCPKKIGGHFICNNNELTNLEFCPEKVGGEVDCKNNTKLEDVQMESDFKKMYQVHRDFVSQFEYEKLYNIIKDSNTIKKNKI